jgi:allophanate hydrolase
MPDCLALGVSQLRRAYADGARIGDVLAIVAAGIARFPDSNAWISRVSDDALAARAATLEAAGPAGLPLYGVPFGVKDNIDVAGLDTTAACPGYAYRPERSATAVERLEAAGAICIGKTNLDQFATGLSGVRSPYGPCSSVFDPTYISGGSSSGSAVAVAAGMVSLALGTDTGGSGRIPAGWNNVVGLKPTRGLVGAGGLVPNCRTLDCVSIFALTVPDAVEALAVVAGWDERDPFSLTGAAACGATVAPAPPRFTFGVPSKAGGPVPDDPASQVLLDQAAARMVALGGVPVPVDFAPFVEASTLMFGGPWVAERLAALRSFVERAPGALLPVTRGIIVDGSAKWSAADTFEAMYRLQALKAVTRTVFGGIDLLLLPTAARPFTHAELEADPIGANNAIGAFSYFVNLLDLAALAVPNGFHPCGVASGVTLVAPAGADAMLASIGAAFHAALGIGPGLSR